MQDRTERARTLMRLAQRLRHSAEATLAAEPPHSPRGLADELDTLAAMLHTIQAELAAVAETIGSMDTAGQARDTETVRTPDDEHQAVTLASVNPLDNNTGTASYAVGLDGDPVGFVGDSYGPDGRRWFAVASLTGAPATVTAAMWDSGPAYRTRAAAIDALARHVQQFRGQQRQADTLDAAPLVKLTAAQADDHHARSCACGNRTAHEAEEDADWSLIDLPTYQDRYQAGEQQ